MEKRSQIERAQKESNAGIEETAAAYAVENRSRISIFLRKSIIKLLCLRNMFIILILLVLILTGAWVFADSTFSKESTTFVEQVQELAFLATAEAHVKVIMEQEDNKLFGKDIQIDIPGTKRELLLVVPATVIVGVDLKAVTSDEILAESKAIGLLQTAEKNAEKVLKEFFGNLGYTVKISFR